jgi:hypothetical protein
VKLLPGLLNTGLHKITKDSGGIVIYKRAGVGVSYKTEKTQKEQ